MPKNSLSRREVAQAAAWALALIVAVGSLAAWRLTNRPLDERARATRAAWAVVLAGAQGRGGDAWSGLSPAAQSRTDESTFTAALAGHEALRGAQGLALTSLVPEEGGTAQGKGTFVSARGEVPFEVVFVVAGDQWSVGDLVVDGVDLVP